MVALSRCLGSVALLASVEGARIARHKETPGTKFIAGVPVLNYHTAYEGEPSLAEGEREGEWVVMVKPGTSDSQIQQMCKVARNGCKLAGHSKGVPFLEMRGTESDLEAVVNTAQGAVKFVEPDQTVHMIPEIESAPEAATWGLNRVGADQRGRSGGSATIFVLDTGVRHSHNDFTGRASSALDMTVGDPKECNGDLSCAGDAQGHGTHCAGTAAGDTYGVAIGAKVKSVKVLSDQGSGSWSWSYYALDWLATNPTRPAIASMSLGGSGTQQAMRDAVDAAVNSGVVVVVAGGNSNSDACRFSPAFVPSAITVGSTTSTDARSSFSNYGSCTNIWAPGSAVVSAGHTSDTSSRSLSGTSMACPHVSGGAALVLDADPSKKSSAVLAELLDTAVVNALTGLRTGDTNALLFVGAGGPPPTPEPVPTPAPPPSECDEATSTGPDSDGDCRCNSGLSCYEGGSQGCTYSYTARYGWRSSRWYSPTCSTCKCSASAAAVAAVEVDTTKASCSSADLAVMQRMGGGSRSGSLAENMARCGRSTLSWLFQWQKEQFIACASQTGLSKSCAGCYEKSGYYGYSNCKTACMAGWCTAGCLSCVKPYDTQLDRCTGPVNLAPPTAC